jgi:phasin
VGASFCIPSSKEIGMAKLDYPKFEIPAEMRALAEKSVDQARQTFDSFMSAAQRAVSGADQQVAGAKELGGLAVKMAERNIAASFEFAQRLVRAKDAQEILALQAEYVKSQIAAFKDQAEALGEQAAKMTVQPGKE